MQRRNASVLCTKVSALYPMDELEATEFLLDKIRATKNNADFFDSMRRG